MKKIRFVSRADDLGSSGSANRAIARVVGAGFIKNVSVMAPGPRVEEAARLLAHRRDVCFGMHTTLNAEWDAVKWGPVLPLDEKSGLVDKNGYFLSDPAQFETTKPAVETIMREVSAQLEKLHALGFDIRYIDSHMLPEMFVEGMDEAMADFAKKKGLVDHMYFYNLPPGFRELQPSLPNVLRFFRGLPEGQYFFVTHPSLDTQEMRKTGNARYSGADVAKGRAFETKVFSKRAVRRLLRLMGCEGVRYDEAQVRPRLTLEEVRKLFSAQ